MKNSNRNDQFQCPIELVKDPSSSLAFLFNFGSTVTPLAAWLNVWRLVNLGSLTIIISAPSVSISVGCTLFGNLWCGWLKFNWVATKPYQNIPEPSKTLHCCCSELWMIRLVGWFLLESSQKTKLPVASVWTSCFFTLHPIGGQACLFQNMEELHFGWSGAQVLQVLHVRRGLSFQMNGKSIYQVPLSRIRNHISNITDQ